MLFDCWSTARKTSCNLLKFTVCEFVPIISVMYFDLIGRSRMELSLISLDHTKIRIVPEIHAGAQTESNFES